MFDGVIIQNMQYEKLNLMSKLISKYYIQLHIKVGILHSFRGSMLINFCMLVGDTYMYGFLKNKSSRPKSRSHEIAFM